MKKVIYLFMLLGLTYFAIGCVRTIEEDRFDPLNGDEIINMYTLDNFMFRDDIQYVDLRNFEDHFATGFIDSFEVIPFFDYLDNNAFYRDDTYEFSSDQLTNSDELYRLFDIDKTILLYADGCIRSGYVMHALEFLGYTNVIVLGGFYEYTGQYLVMGDGSYDFGDTFYAKFENETTGDVYYVYGTTDLSRKITEIRFDIINSDGRTYRGNNFDSLVDYNNQLLLLEEFILDDILTLFQLSMELNNVDLSSYYTIEGFELNIFEELIKLIAKTNSYTNQ
ncbi:MAG: hypothetical protein QM489_06200 [Candidatus Izemoplasma sp.]